VSSKNSASVLATAGAEVEIGAGVASEISAAIVFTIRSVDFDLFDFFELFDTAVTFAEDLRPPFLRVAASASALKVRDDAISARASTERTALQNQIFFGVVFSVFITQPLTAPSWHQT
jgi:hypothetical protein